MKNCIVGYSLKCPITFVFVDRNVQAAVKQAAGVNGATNGRAGPKLAVNRHTTRR